MADLWRCGFETQNLTAGVEVGTVTGSPTISTTTKASGDAAMRCNPTAAAWYIQKTVRADTNSNIYGRVKIRIDTTPSAKVTIAAYGDSANFYGCKIRLGTDRKLYTDNSGLTLQTAGTTVLNTGQWYSITFFYDETNNQVTVKIDGVTEINAAGVDDIGGGGRIRVGIIEATTADIYFDDLAFNDTTGSVETSYPNYLGKIVHGNPDSAGDNAGFTLGAGSGANYLQVDEVNPNDATDYVQKTTTGTVIDDHNVESSSSMGISSNATITLIEVHLRGGSTATTAGATISPRVKSAASGTVSTGTAGAFNVNGWRSDGAADPLPLLISYTDPTTGVAWTPTGTNSIDNMQIGYTNAASNTTARRVTAVWALIEYVPASASSIQITKSLQYCIKAPVAVTKSLKYAVKKTVSAVTKSLAYDVRKSIGVTKSLTYDIKKAVSITKSLKYTTKTTPSAITKSLKYTVRKSISITKGLIYDVKKSQSVTKSLTYRVVKTQTAITKTSQYAIKKATTVTKGLIYDIKKSNAITKSLQYAIRRQVQITKSLQYTTRRQTAITKSLQYKLPSNTVVVQKSLKYTVKLPVSITKSLKYTVKTTGTAITKSARYAVRRQLSATKSLVYDIKRPANITKSLKYTIKTTPSAISKSLRYATRKSLSITKTLTYDIRRAGSLTKSLRYAVRKQYSIAKVVIYVTRRQQSITKGLQYSIGGSKSIAKQLSYAVETTSPTEPVSLDFSKTADMITVNRAQASIDSRNSSAYLETINNSVNLG